MAAKQYRLAVQRNLFITKAAIEGPGGLHVVRLLVDTGSQFTFIAREILETVGYDPAAQRERQDYVTTAGIGSVPVVRLHRFSCLGQALNHFPVLAYTLPFARYMNGVLGMDFLHRFPFKIDTLRGVIESHGGRGSRDSGSRESTPENLLPRIYLTPINPP